MPYLFFFFFLLILAENITPELWPENFWDATVMGDFHVFLDVFRVPGNHYPFTAQKGVKLAP